MALAALFRMLFTTLLVATAFAITSGASPNADRPLTPDQVVISVNQALAWYRDVRVTMRATGLVSHEDQEAALAVLRSAFDAARAEAAVLALEQQPSNPSEQARATKRDQVKAAVQKDEQDLDRLRTRLRRSPARQRQELDAQVAVATNRLEFDQARLEFITKLEQFNASSPATTVDLAQQIQTLEDSVPELHGGTATPQPSPPASDGSATPASGTWALVHRLLALQRTQRNLGDLVDATNGLTRNVDGSIQATQAAVHPMMERLRSLTAEPAAGASLTESEQTFRDLLERAKRLGAVMLARREESARAHRYAADVQAWKRMTDNDVTDVIRSLAFNLIGVVIAFAAILIGAVLWGILARRYVHDVYLRHLLTTLRTIVVATAMVLVLVFHFASELTALVAGLGFAAAGIAFALQNVILSLAGYFSMVAPNGIRVGDRVSLQGPFGYVQGDVVDIGFVRIRLRELSGDPLKSTGRIVIFPNSVVFTGSFFKHPPSGQPSELRRPAQPGAAA